MTGTLIASKALRQFQLFLIADDPLILRGLEHLVENNPDISICGYDKATPGALEGIGSSNPDLIIIDISTSGSAGLCLIDKISSMFPSKPVLVLAMPGEAFYADRAMHAGARGYFLKDDPIEKVILAIRQILDGDVYLSGKIQSHFLDRLVGEKTTSGVLGVERLSNRELNVFELIGQGFTTREIAQKLDISVKTIESHKEHIKKKLNLINSDQLLHQAFLWRDYLA